jgi:hypothetical protein
MRRKWALSNNAHSAPRSVIERVPVAVLASPTLRQKIAANFPPFRTEPRTPHLTALPRWLVLRAPVWWHPTTIVVLFDRDCQASDQRNDFIKLRGVSVFEKQRSF